MHRAETAAMIISLLFSPSLSARMATCASGSLLHQRRDAETIDRLERAWTLAYLSGDVTLERCLLTREFTAITRTGKVTTLKDELALAEANRGKDPMFSDPSEHIVLLHGNVAVAYGKSALKDSDGTIREVRYADYYVWELNRWHAYFAQQTNVPET